MTTHQQHIEEMYGIAEAQYNELFDEKFISEQIVSLNLLELASLKQESLHSSITAERLIEINTRITLLEQKKLMHILKYK